MKGETLRNDSINLISDVIQDLNGICEDCGGCGDLEAALSDIEDRIQPAIKALTMVHETVNSYLTGKDQKGGKA